MDHPLDTCKCGDYRRDHKDGHGPCIFNGRGFDLCHADADCMEFRLSYSASRDTPIPETPNSVEGVNND